MNVIPPIIITDAIFDTSDVPENDNPEWVISTPYVIGDKVMVSTVEPDIHENFEALANSTGVEPWTDDGTTWLNLGSTNRWAMFDELNASQTTQANVVTVELTPGELFDSVALLNVDALQVQVIVTDPVEGVVYDETRPMQSTSGINTWHAYYFTAIVQTTDIVFLNLPAFPNATVKIITSFTGGTVAIGVCVIGAQKNIGITDHGTSSTIIDYSTKTTDQFGNFTILKKAFSKRSDYQISVDTNRVADIQNFLASIRATVVVWVGNGDFGSTIIYGYYRDFDLVLSSPQLSDCNIVVEGLT